MEEKSAGFKHVHHNGFPLSKDDKISWLHRLTRTRVGLILFALVVVACSSLPGCFCPPTALMLLNTGLIVGHIKMRRFANYAIGCWVYALAYAVGTFFGIRVRIFGHSQRFSDRCIIILNHRCHFDWLYFWMVIAQRGDVDKWSVVLKLAGKYMPFLGWAMQCRNYFFLSRHWHQDKKELTWKLNYLRATDSPYQILMFPEGTDLTPKSKVKSDAYAETNGLPKLEYTLHPKSRGFIYMLQGLRRYKIDAVYDMTVGYPDKFAKTEIDLISNCNMPREIHYHVSRYDAATIPETDEGVETWLRERWMEKEERLRRFYADREFRAEPSAKEETGETDVISNGRPMRDGLPECTSPLYFWVFLRKQLFYSGQFIVLLYLCMLHWYFIVYLTITTSIMIYWAYVSDGIDYFFMRQLKRERGQFVHSLDTEVDTVTKVNGLQVTS